MGQLVRLNTVFGNKRLPVIIDRDISALESEILSLPNLRGFWDMSDTASRTVSGGKITKILDKSAAANHLVADHSSAPVVDGSVLGGLSSAYFDGSVGMVSEGNVFNAAWDKVTFVVFAVKSEITNPINTVLVAGKTNATVTLYTNNSNIGINSANLFLNGGVNLPGKPISVIASTNLTENRSAIRSEESVVQQSNLAPRTLKTEPIYIGRWPENADQEKAIGWKGYIGHVMVFNGYIEDSHYISDLLLEYARRKYNTSAWENR